MVFVVALIVWILCGIAGGSILRWFWFKRFGDYGLAEWTSIMITVIVAAGPIGMVTSALWVFTHRHEI